MLLKISEQCDLIFLKIEQISESQKVFQYLRPHFSCILYILIKITYESIITRNVGLTDGILIEMNKVTCS